jgi:hypothetical protein
MTEDKKDSAKEFDDEFLRDPIGEVQADPLGDDKVLPDPLDDFADDSLGAPFGKAPENPLGEVSGDKAREPLGYGRPPKEGRFKKGQSGNPKGRPKGAKNESTILKEILLNRKVPMRDGGRMRKVQVLEAMLLRFAEDSLKGNTKSAAFLLNRFGQKVSGEVEAPEISEDDREILEAYVRKIQAKNDKP